jgi:hypothetical protein
MSKNKKIWYGDNYPKSINEDINEKLIAPPPDEGPFTFDSMAITFDSLTRTFDEQ